MNRALLVFAVAAVAALGGCKKNESATDVTGSNPGLFGPRARYSGVGHYTPGRLWTEVAGAEAGKDPAAARPADDDEVIVVVDGATGEIRQCGNMSGVCISMNPWAKAPPAGRSAPVALNKHAEDLDRTNEVEPAMSGAEPSQGK
jgi:hypothetical protein